MKVDFATLQSMAGRCRGEAADTTARHASLSSSINASVLEGWTDSQAAVRFSELYEGGGSRRRASAMRSPAWGRSWTAWRPPISSTRRTWPPASVR